jgi:hypothetical protein
MEASGQFHIFFVLTAVPIGKEALIPGEWSQFHSKLSGAQSCPRRDDE